MGCRAQAAIALGRQLAPGFIEVALQQRKLADQRLQRGFGLVEQHDAYGSDHRTLFITQRQAADHKVPALLVSRSMSTGWPVSSTRRIWVLGMTSSTIWPRKSSTDITPSRGKSARSLRSPRRYAPCDRPGTCPGSWTKTAETWSALPAHKYRRHPPAVLAGHGGDWFDTHFHHGAMVVAALPHDIRADLQP